MLDEQLKDKMTLMNSAITVIIAGVFMFYANLVYYNTSPVSVVQGKNLLDTTFMQSIPTLSIVVTGLFYAIAVYLLFRAGRGLVLKGTWLVTSLLILFVGIMFYSNCYNHVWVLTRPMGGLTDEYVLQYNAAKEFLHLHNPYNTDFTNQIIQSVPMYYRTYLTSATFVHNIDYPAFSFLYYLPSAVLNVSGIYQDIFVMAIVVGFVCYKSPSYLKWFLPVFFLFDYAHVFFPSASITDVCWVCLIILALFYKNKVVFSGVLMGLAVSYKEEALVILPFFLILLWKDLGVKLLIKSIVAMATTVAIVNIPFLLMNPSNFIKDVLLPITGNTASGGIGLSAFNLNIPKHVYTALFVGALVVGVWLYYKKFSLFKISGICIFPMIAFWLNSRSFQNYFIWLPIFTVVLIIAEAVKIDDRNAKAKCSFTNLTTNYQ